MGAKREKNQLDSLLINLVPVLAEIDRRGGISASVTPNLPATQSDIAAAESKLTFAFPPSYLQFLRLHNGWDRFNAGDICVLGVSGPAYKKAVAQWKRDLAIFEKSFRRKGRTYALDLQEKSKRDPKVIHLPSHIPVATNYNEDWWIFDRNRRSEDGEYEIARVGHGEYVDDRSASFREFVEENVRRKQAELRKLQGQPPTVRGTTQHGEPKKAAKGEAARASPKKRPGGGKRAAVKGR